MPNNEPSHYGDSGFRRFDTFDESGLLRVVHSNETPTAPSRSTVQRTNPSMKPAGRMKYQPAAKTKMVGNRPVTNPKPSVGLVDGDYQDVVDLMGADENEPMTGEERHELQAIAEDWWGESNSNVF